MADKGDRRINALSRKNAAQAGKINLHGHRSYRLQDFR